MITGPQCRAARALVEVTRSKLALRSGIDESVIEGFERIIDEPAPDVIATLEKVLQELGAIFIEENGGGKVSAGFPPPSGSACDC
ncbi:helix-turn-helix domain-containing protein [Mycoplana dimorpha]|uniref:helix-turn-helix domain-containing protein n=1 Tax=Mycoplana dimorpha TaxID=28320 RepID=UPI0011B25F81|nr:helix-turn-helix transcriptional regulator [Mycoplana dimorpha]